MSARKPPPTLRDFLFSVAKIVEGALAPDPAKVKAYAEQLRDRLDDAGETQAAARLDRALGRRSARPVSLGSAVAERLPVDSESRLPLGDEEMVTDSDIVPVLPDDTRSSIEKFVRYVRCADELAARGVAISASLLLYGPPGCGKTLLARHIARELRLPIVTARTDALISSYLGSTSKNLRLLFENAMSRPCVLFLDEFDALGKMRDDDRELGELKRVVISLLQNIDAMGADHVLIAATNHEHLLDRAVWRRFAHKLRLDLPSVEDRRQMLSQFLRDFASPDDASILAVVTEEVSGGELRDLCNEALREAIVNTRREIQLGTFLATIGRSRPHARGDGWQSMSPAEQIRRLVELHGDVLTQTQVSKLVGVSQSYVSKVLKK